MIAAGRIHRRMLMSISLLRPLVRQWLFPPEFRISVAGTGDAAATLADLLVRAMAALEDVQAQARSASLRDAQPAAPSIPPNLALALANYYFRLSRNAERLGVEGGESKELRSIRRVLEDLTDALREHGVECIDLTGQDYDPGRVDFEQLGVPEVQAGLARDRIGRCERPAVLLNGKLLQKAKGIVARPA